MEKTEAPLHNLNWPAIEQDMKALRDWKAGKWGRGYSGLKFQYEHFGHHLGTHPAPEQNYCGTTACLVGLIALAPNSPYHVRWYFWTEYYSMECTFENSYQEYAIARRWGITTHEEERGATKEFSQLLGLFLNAGKLLDTEISKVTFDQAMELLEAFVVELRVKFPPTAEA